MLEILNKFLDISTLYKEKNEGHKNIHNIKFPKGMKIGCIQRKKQLKKHFALIKLYFQI